ncbi:phosphonate ABC transporter ATP-binding protein [Hutsoniella sourekii]|uniref:phosphonate ABC transporter ATP-binding protein n=1 Tax=Hutsoniella sourekii TaxID=87650 RepID=UPI000488E3E0|nr:phosphonate ABC transporter ATP-binding protein [Hutsoniella sourekii]
MIEIKNVSKVFDNGVVGLKNINLTIEDGEFICIIGLSGAGKSTLLRSLNRLNEISEGEIVINGESLTHASPKELRRMRRHIGMVFQQFNLVRKNTVQKNVLSGRLGYYNNWQTLIGHFSKEDYERVERALATVNLSDKLKVRSDALSGGQQQRVSIARTIVQEADIILADEPVSALDPVTSQTVMNDFKRLNEEDNRTVIINIHSIALARQYATRIIGMRAGEVVFDGPASEATDQRLGEIYGAEIFKEEEANQASAIKEAAKAEAEQELADQLAKQL